MSSRSFVIGAKPTFTVTFRAAVAAGVDPETGTPTDPSTVIFMWKIPDGTETTYTYGVATEVTKSSTGVYVFAPPVIAASGKHRVRAKGTAGLIAAVEDTVLVALTPFTTP